MNIKRQQEGFSLIELLIVVAIIGIIATIAVPQLLDAIDRSRQRRTMADMRNIATANGTFRVDTGAYAAALANLAPIYMQVVPTNDAWATVWTYAGGATYTLTSLGSNKAVGPAAPSPWTNAAAQALADPYAPDLILTNGQFTAAPTGQ